MNTYIHYIQVRTSVHTRTHKSTERLHIQKQSEEILIANLAPHCNSVRFP